MMRLRRRYPQLGDDRGQITAFAMCAVLMLWLFAGIVVDGGLALAGKVAALNTAQEAARTGAQQLDTDRLRGQWDVRLRAASARDSALGYVRDRGDSAAATVTGDEVTVRVTHRQPMQILGLVGIHSMSMHGEATARAESGTTLPDPRSARRG
ncbi:TadE/TadG family type IV pilus assembly protein [Streptomyces monticola]|uniref:TadE/TadG family type IV pilus assembly protein n=1 Tax=Streptomyces monticola TaxID=2666263 RepID=A0ABW2JL23_9ACTN